MKRSPARRLPLARAHMAGGPQPGEEVLFRERRVLRDYFAAFDDALRGGVPGLTELAA